MRVRFGLACMLTIVAVEFGWANVPVQQPAGGRGAFIDRFLAPNEPPLVSYRAFRRLTASTRGGHLRAAIEAWTTLDPMHGFSFEITSEEGSAIIRRKVLIAALEAEQMAVAMSDRAQTALTPSNYEFLGISPESDRLVKMDVRPRRKHVMLVHGAVFIEADSADLVRVEGELSQRPSIWTRRVHVIREYDRVEGVHVPVSMRSTADVLLVGSSSFTMTYRYVEINGKTVTPVSNVTNEPKDK
jgi:hypothetical protein